MNPSLSNTPAGRALIAARREFSLAVRDLGRSTDASRSRFQSAKDDLHAAVRAWEQELAERQAVAS